jgi:NADPH:quinone reductase-like Zn-dependent oxidoreductase
LPEGTDRILVCSPLDAGARLSEPTSDALDRALESVYDVPLAMIQRAAAASIAPSSVVIVTSGSVAVREDLEVVSPLQGAAWGLARVARHEHPSIGCVSLDIGALELADALDAGVLSVEESELAWREGQWWASRIEHALSTMRHQRRHRATRAERYAPTSRHRAPWTRSMALPTSPGRTSIAAAPLANFLCLVMNAPSAGADHISAAPRLGLECTGVVTRLGRNVHDVAVGDRVMALWEGSLGSHVIAPAALVARVPAGVAFESASGFPIAFLTAARALEDAARLRAGERVLIHSAAGGVGLAAIQVARCAGADVLATAGTPEKRALLRSMGIEHVFDSRRLDWGDEVLAATGGVGVDVVLNSLAGAAIETGFRALAPYGRFIEIGKRDVFGDTRIGMEVFRKQAMVTSVYLLEQMREDPEALGVRFRQLVATERGELQLLPTTPWSTDADGRLAPTSAAAHVARCVVRLHEHGTYVITGGLGSLGQQAAAWLVARGARHLVFVGRSAPGPEALRAIAALEAHGVIVVSLAADIARPEAIARLRTQLATMPPLRGVLHAAGVLDDGPIAAQTPERMRLVAAAKLGGLLQLASMPELAAADFLVLYSSVAGALGTRGQANYAAANAALDAMAHALRAGGVRATSIGLVLSAAAVWRQMVVGFDPAGIGALRLAQHRPDALAD